MPPGEAVDKAFSTTQATKNTNRNIRDHALRGVDIGRGGTGTKPFQKIADVPRLDEHLLRTTYGYQKDPLFKTLKNTSYSSIVKSEIKGQIQANTNWKNVARSVEATDLLDENVLPKYIRDLETAGRRAIVNKTDFESYRRQLNKAEKQIAKLKNNTQLKTAYNRVVKAVDKGSITQIDKAIDNAVKKKMRYNAERIARTELEFSYGQAKTEEFLANDIISAMRFTLDSSHLEIDVCDTYANADLYGLGPGVYPKDEGPTLAIHPNGKSSWIGVSIATIPETEAKKANFKSKNMESYLKANPKKQTALLGRKGAQEFRENPNSWKKNLRQFKPMTENVTRLPK
jgi:hypothetical protein